MPKRGSEAMDIDEGEPVDIHGSRLIPRRRYQITRKDGTMPVPAIATYQRSEMFHGTSTAVFSEVVQGNDVGTGEGNYRLDTYDFAPIQRESEFSKKLRREGANEEADRETRRGMGLDNLRVGGFSRRRRRRSSRRKRSGSRRR